MVAGIERDRPIELNCERSAPLSTGSAFGPSIGMAVSPVRNMSGTDARFMPPTTRTDATLICDRGAMALKWRQKGSTCRRRLSLATLLNSEGQAGQGLCSDLAPEVSIVALYHCDAGPRNLRNSKQIESVMHEIADDAVPHRVGACARR